MTVSRRLAGSPLRYALAPIYVAVAVLLHQSTVGEFFHPMGPFILAVVGSAWFGGTATGILAAFLSAIALPHLIAITYPLSMAYPLLAGFFDVPRFITLGLAGAAVGGGRAAYWRVESALRERQRAEEALRESEDRYERVIAATEAGFFDWDLTTDRYYVSPRLLEMAGIPPGTRISGRADFERRVHFHPEDIAKWQQEMKALFASSGARLSTELRVFRGEETRWYRIDGMCFRDAAGNVVRWTGSSIDITPHKIAEDAVRRSEQRYALAMEAAGDGHTDWDLVSGEFYISPRLLGILGYSPGTTFADRADWVRRFPFHPEDRRRWEAAVAAHFAGREAKFRMDLRVVVGGETRWVAFTFIASRDAAGKPVRWTGSIADVNDAKLAEEALRESQERYALAVAGSDDGVWDIDLVAGRVFVSARARALVGMPSGSEMLSLDEFSTALPIHPEDAPRRAAAMQAHLEGKAPAYEGEFRMLQPDGVYRWRRLHGLCLRDAGGKPHRMAGSISDIDARRRAEEALRQSEERHALALEAAADGHFDTNFETDVSFVSARLAEIYGYPRVARTVNRVEWVKQIPLHPDDRALLADLLRPEWEDPARNSYEFQYRIVPRPGETRWIHLRGLVTRDAQGRALRRVGVVTDITARKLVEEALRLSEQRYALALEVTEEGHFDWNAQTDQIFASAKALRVMNVPQDGQYRTRSDIQAHVRYHPEDWPRISEEWRAALAGRGLEHEFEYRILRGEEPRSIRGRWKVFRDADGAAQRVIGVVSDVTERKRVDEALHQSEERYALAVEGSNEGIFDWDLVSDRVYVSHRAQELFGLPRGELWRPRRDWRHILTFHPDDAPRLHDGIKAHIEGGTPTYDEEFRIVMPDGGVRWFRQRGIALRDASGKAYRIVGSIGDVTEMRKMEQELSRAQRLEGMGTLAGGIAHDFNNILGAILGYGEMAMRYARLGTRLRRDVESIMAAGERGRALVDRVLAFSRSGVAERVPVHVEAVVREALDQVAASLPEDVTITPRLRAGRAAILGDSTQVHQVVMNLASNAAQAMPEGGVIRVWLDIQRVEAPRAALVGAVSPGEHIVLKVTDAGTGIRPEVLESMFDPFFTTKEVGVGSGLGLSLVHGIVTSVGGAIDVTTKLGKGTTFTVYLPRSGDAPEKAADENRPLPRGEGQRVLVVDDEEPLVRLATETLERLGYAPVGFTSSTAALAAFRAEPGRFDAVLTDERMPGLSGSALIRELRGIRDAIPVILMSGYLGAESVDADIVLKKPLSASDLAASMAQALRP